MEFATLSCLSCLSLGILLFLVYNCDGWLSFVCIGSFVEWSLHCLEETTLVCVAKGLASQRMYHPNVTLQARGHGLL